MEENNNNDDNNCKTKIDCPMNGMCNLKNLEYQATIYPKENVKDLKKYVGISLVMWHFRYKNYINSFTYERLKNQTALSKHFWKLKNMGLTPKIQWKMLNRSTTARC